MEDHGNEQWESHRHHHGGSKRFRSRPRLGPPGFPGAPGYDPAADTPGFRRGHEFGGPEFGGPEFRGRAYDPREYGERGPAGPAFEGPGFDPDFPPGPGFHGHPGFGPRGRGYGRRGSRAKRGDVRAAALALIAEEPINGYQIIQQIAERSGGLWRPSPGSVYPALAQLEDEGLIEMQGTDGGRRAYAVTEAGTAYVAEHPDELRAPWSAAGSDAAAAAVDMRSLVRQVHLAAFQVVTAGTDAQVTQARDVLTQARRSLYRILAADDEATDQGTGVEPGA
jgi:DNA-binding PadR family transcriptional regulator